MNTEKVYASAFDGEKIVPGYFYEKIRNFESVCKINIPIYEIKQIEKAIQVKNGKVFIVGGAVRDLIMKTKMRTRLIYQSTLI